MSQYPLGLKPDLNPANDALCHVSNKVVCVAVIPPARVIAHDELLAGGNGQICELTQIARKVADLNAHD